MHYFLGKEKISSQNLGGVGCTACVPVLVTSGLWFDTHRTLSVVVSNNIQVSVPNHNSLKASVCFDTQVLTLLLSTSRSADVTHQPQLVTRTGTGNAVFLNVSTVYFDTHAWMLLLSNRANYSPPLFLESSNLKI